MNSMQARLPIWRIRVSQPRRQGKMPLISEPVQLAIAAALGGWLSKFFEFKRDVAVKQSDVGKEYQVTVLGHSKELFQLDAERLKDYSDKIDLQDGKIEELQKSIGILHESMLEERRMNTNLLIKISELEQQNKQLVELNETLRKENENLKVVNSELRAQVRDRLQSAQAVMEEVKHVEDKVDKMQKEVTKNTNSISESDKVK